jgi:lipopolysaccharide export system protein LptA
MSVLRVRQLLVLGLVLATTGASQGQTAQGPGLNLGKHDTNAPINVSSDIFVGDFQTKVGTYVGNVVVTQADYKLRADTVKVDVVGGQPNKFFADGRVVFDSPSGTATGDHGIYDLTPPRTMTLTGNVILTKQKDVMRGTTLVVNLVTGLAHLTAKGMPANRVQSLFIPKPQPSSGGPAQTSPKAPQN